VCIAQNGPGITNFVTAVAAAYWAHSPVVVITPETGSMTLGLGGFQETEQLPIFSKITRYQAHVNNRARMAELSSRAFDRALLEMGPAQLNIPRDFFYGDIECEIPRPIHIERGAGGERAGSVPSHSGRGRSHYGQRYCRSHCAGRATACARGLQLPA
jgi:sulfoacetaldehyde acetyltransferase